MDEISSDSIRAELQRLGGEPPAYPAGRFAGRGIVICAGGTIILTNAYVLVRLLRDTLACTLSIEIWHLGQGEMPRHMAALFETLGCRVVDAIDVMREFPATVRDGWQLKVYALMNSAFEEVLLLDADQVPVHDPSCVFDWPSYRDAGAVFWPDVVDLAPTNPVWALTGLAAERVTSWESGQLCIDKRRHWHAAGIVQWIVERSDIFFRVVYGDKDAFLIGWRIAGAPHALVPHAPFKDARYLGQRDFDGGLIFQHRTNAKWSLREPPYRPDGFVWQAECEAFMADLEAVWNERAFAPPARSAAARRIEHDLVAQHRFRFGLGDDAPLPLALLDGNQVGEGRSYRMSNWHVEETGDGFDLVIHDHFKPSFRLHRIDARLWQGTALTQGGQQAVLEADSAFAGIGETPPSRTLADDIIDAALRGTDRLDATALAAALTLLSEIETGVARSVSRRATALAATDPQTAASLRKIAGDLAGRRRGAATRPVQRPDDLLASTEFYIRTER